MLGRHQHQQPGENTYSLPTTELPPDEPPPPYDAINKDRVILSWDGVAAGPSATQYIRFQAAPSSVPPGNYSQQDNSARFTPGGPNGDTAPAPSGGHNQTTQTPLRRSQRSRGSNNRMLDRNNRPSSARSSQRRSNSHVLDDDVNGGNLSPNLARHRRHGSSGQILEPGALERRGSRERVIDPQGRRQSRNPPGPGIGRPVGGCGGGNPQGAPTAHRTHGHKRTGSDSLLIDNRTAPLSHLSGDVIASQKRNNRNNLSIDSSVPRLTEPNTVNKTNNSANYYSPPSEISTASYESMAPSAPNVSQQPRLVLPPMPNRTQQPQPQQQQANHLPHSTVGEHPSHVTPRHHQRATVDNKQYSYHTPSVNNNQQQQHSPSQQDDTLQQRYGGPLQINTGQLSPHHADNEESRFHSPRGAQPHQMVSPHYNPGQTGVGPRSHMRFPRTNPSLPPRPCQSSPREGYQGQLSPQSYGLAIRPTVGGTTHGPHSPPLSLTSPSLSSSPQSHPSPPIPPTEHTLAHTHAPPSPNDEEDQGPNQPLEILPAGNVTTIWGLDSTTV